MTTIDEKSLLVYQGILKIKLHFVQLLYTLFVVRMFNV